MLLACLFPWSSPLPIASDAQPLAFLLALIYLIINVRTFNCYLFSAVIMLVGAFLGFLSSTWGDGLRGLFGYISVILIPSALLHYFKRYGLPKYELYRGVLIVWGIVGLIQFRFPSLIQFLSSRDGVYALSGGRGVHSFAPEPTFYAMFLIFISLAIFIQSSNNESFGTVRQINTLFIFIFFQILFLSQSSLVLLFLITSAFIYSLVRMPFHTLAIIVVIATVFFSSIDFSLYDFEYDDIRLLRLLWDFNDLSSFNIAEILSIDGSISDRAVQIIGSHYISASNWFLPHGFSEWSVSKEKLPYFISDAASSIEGLNRVLSFSGSMLFEVGIFSIPFLMMIFYLIMVTTPGRGLRIKIIKISILITFCTQAFPLGLATIGLILAILISTINKNKVN